MIVNKNKQLLILLNTKITKQQILYHKSPRILNLLKDKHHSSIVIMVNTRKVKINFLKIKEYLYLNRKI